LLAGLERKNGRVLAERRRGVPGRDAAAAAVQVTDGRTRAVRGEFDRHGPADAARGYGEDATSPLGS
jgi:hypothetical protein